MSVGSRGKLVRKRRRVRRRANLPEVKLAA
jgi:hypothetical protein